LNRAVCQTLTKRVQCFSPLPVLSLQDAEDANPLIRALAIRTMGYISVDKVTEALVYPLRQSLRDGDPYVRKTAATTVAKLFMHDKELVESEGFIDMLRDMLTDSNPTVSS